MMHPRSIALLAALLAGGYAGASLLDAGQVSQDALLAGGQAVASAQLAAERIVGELRGKELKPFEHQVLEATGQPWRQNLFAAPPPLEGAVAAAQGEPVYHGYLEIGGRRIAVIDGVEYEPGQELAGGGRVVADIEPARVTLRPAAGGLPVVIPFKGQ